VRRPLLGLLVWGLLAAPPLHAQQPALDAYAGWKWGGSLNTREGELNLAASEHFGLALAIPVRPDATALLLADYQPTELRLKSGGVNEKQFDVNIWYFMLGGQVEMDTPARVVPFAMGTLGVAWFDPSGSRSSETAFAAIFGGGVKVPIGQSERVSLKLEGRLHLTIPWAGGSLYCGTGGCYTSVGGAIGPVQGSVMGGLSIPLGSRR